MGVDTTLLASAQEDRSTTFYLRLAFTILAILFFALLYSTRRVPWPKNAPKQSFSEWPILGSLRFFSDRWNFLREAAVHSLTGQHSFHVGGYSVVGLSGEEGRRAFFESRQLSLGEGYATLLNSVPPAPNQKQEADGDFTAYFIKRIIRLLQRERLSKSLSLMTSDTHTAFEALAASGSSMTDPFDSIYRLVYQLTMRTVGCADIADSPELLRKTLAWFHLVEESTTAASTLFPRLPGVGYFQRMYGGARLYTTLKKVVDSRARTGTRVDDPLQFLIDEGDDMMHIIGFVISGLIAGLLNSGINAGFVLAYLAHSPEWLAHVRAEVETVADKYTPDEASHQTLAARLAHVPLEAWESELPIVDLCLRDSIRLQTLGSGFRRNISNRDVPIGSTGEVIPAGAFAAYPLDDIHMNPAVYQDPTKWDPARYLDPRNEDKKAPLTFVGWGAGRHPCVGMRFAKLESNVIVAYWAAMFDFSLCDEQGMPTDVLPVSNRDAWTARKPQPGCRLRFEAREKSGA